jgi:type 1 glutamine amidotransferase
VEEGFLDWAGGNKKKVYSQLAFSDGQQAVATPGHAIARGVTPFAVHEELYYRYMFRDGDKRVTPILTAMLPPDKPQREIVAWALERADGGRAFMYAGPHFITSWRVESLRRMVLNAIVWTAKAEVPEGGVRSTLPTIRDKGT